jgi:hypothetical protein
MSTIIGYVGERRFRQSEHRRLHRRNDPTQFLRTSEFRPSIKMVDAFLLSR